MENVKKFPTLNLKQDLAQLGVLPQIIEHPAFHDVFEVAENAYSNSERYIISFNEDKKSLEMKDIADKLNVTVRQFAGETIVSSSVGFNSVSISNDNVLKTYTSDDLKVPGTKREIIREFDKDGIEIYYSEAIATHHNKVPVSIIRRQPNGYIAEGMHKEVSFDEKGTPQIGEAKIGYFNLDIRRNEINGSDIMHLANKIDEGPHRVLPEEIEGFELNDQAIKNRVTESILNEEQENSFWHHLEDSQNQGKTR